MDAAPFRAVRYDPTIAGPASVTSAPAYDDVERAPMAEHRSASPHTVLELIRPTGEEGYFQAGRTLRQWLASGVLVEDDRPAFFVYEEQEALADAIAVQRGVLAAVHLAPSRGADLVPHEDVLDARVDERVARLRAVPLDLAPIFALHDGAAPELPSLLEPPAAPPLLELTDGRGVAHRVWAVTDDDAIAGITEALRGARAVIADGHHRYAAALRRRTELRTAAAGENRTGEAPWDRTLVYLVDAQSLGPRVAPLHRLLPRWPDDALERLEAAFEVEDAPTDEQSVTAVLARQPFPAMAVHLGDKAHVLRPRPGCMAAALPPAAPSSWQRIDGAAVVHCLLPRLGMSQEDAQVMRDAERAVAAVRSGGAAAAALLRAVPAADVLQLALAGQVLPPKTTSFHPKPRAGLIMRRAG